MRRALQTADLHVDREPASDGPCEIEVDRRSGLRQLPALVAHELDKARRRRLKRKLKALGNRATRRARRQVDWETES